VEELELNALNFEPIIGETYEYDTEFRELMVNIYSCYVYLIQDISIVPCNNENAIRDILFKYLRDTQIRQNSCLIEGYRFDKEVDENAGRVDIKIIDKNDFEEHDAYYVIECKRLNGYSTLNRAYISDGINRFTTGYYSSHYGINGMIGFVVENINIDSNMLSIANFFNTIENHKLYESNHDNLKLYHLMLDFSTLCE